MQLLTFAMVQTRSMTKRVIETQGEKPLKKKVKLEDTVQEIPPPPQNIYHQWEEAMVSDDWKQSPFHERLFQTYVQRLFDVEGEQQEDLKRLIDQGLGGTNVSPIVPRVGVCHLCGKYRTLSKVVKLADGGDIYTGRFCAEKFVRVLTFYGKMQDLKLQMERHREETVHNILRFWEDLLLQMEQSAKA